MKYTDQSMQMIRALLFVVFLTPLSCSSALAQQESSQLAEESSRYDLGRLAGPWKFDEFPIASLEVKSVVWLDGTQMQFRREYDDRWRRRAYSNSQWIAPPAALLERFLTRRIVFRQSDPKGRGCHLTFHLHELDQTFSTPTSSYVTLEVLVTLSTGPLAKAISKRAFFIQQAAPTPDAVGSVAATREAAQLLLAGIDEWLSEVPRKTPRIATRCRSVK